MCVAIRVPGEGALLAADSRVLAGYEIVTDNCDKFVVAGNVVALVCGKDGGLMDVLPQARTFEELRELARDYTSDKNLSWELLVFDRKTERLVRLDSDDSMIPVGLAHAVGAGADLAQGFLAGQGKVKDLDTAERLARRAIAIAVKHNVSCGGKTRVVRVVGKRRPVIVK